MPVVQGIFFAIQLGVTKLLETTEPNSFSSTDNRHHVKRRSFMSVIVNDKLNGLVVDYQINAVHEASFKKREERSGNLAMPLSPPSRQPF